MQLLKGVGLGGSLEQGAAEVRVVVHRSAAVDQKQDLDGVSPGIPVADLQQSRPVAGVTDRPLHIQHLFRIADLCGKLPQQAEGHLELAGVQGGILAEVPEPALSRHRQRRPAPALAAHPEAVGPPSGISKDGAALGPDPVIAAVVLLGLFPEALFQHLQDLLQGLVLSAAAPQFLQGAPEVLRRVIEPVHQFPGQLSLPRHIPEELQKHLVKAVIFRLTVQQHRPAELVKSRERGAMQPLLHALQQRQPLVEGDVQSSLAKQVKK